MTTLPRSTWALLAFGAITLAACSEQTVEPNGSHSAGDPLSAKGGKPGGGGGGVDPVDPTILFTNPMGKKLGYTLYWMDDTGNMMRVLGDADEKNVSNIDPRWSPDASQFLVRRSFRDRHTGWTDGQLWIADADGTNLTYVLDIGWPGVARWLGSDRIVFIDSNGDLVATDLDGIQVDQLTTSGDLRDHVTSPDGSRILARVTDQLVLRLYTVSCTPSPSPSPSPCAVTSQTEISGSDLGLGIEQDFDVQDWAHKQDRVLVRVHIGWGNRDISVLDLSGPEPSLSTLVITPVDEYNAAWSDDDSRIVFARFPSATSRTGAGLVIRDVASGVETEVATSVGPMGIDWRPTPPAGP